MNELFSCSRRGVLRAVVVGGTLPFFVVTAVAQAQNSIQGNWSFAWEGASDNYAGTLDVGSAVSAVAFSGRLTIRPSKGGTIVESAQITVTGNDVQIECSSPTSVDRDVSDWAPDRFYVKQIGDRMEGTSVDTMGRRGRSIVFTRIKASR
ncbi:MAG TPA: hypothetical protein VN809_00150 [Telmatospirillum sp.]|nr:hypothetical protein [Telmatospirillum sp.]